MPNQLFLDQYRRISHVWTPCALRVINFYSCRLRSSNGLSLGEFDQWFSHIYLPLFLSIFKLFYLVLYVIIRHFMLGLCVLMFSGSYVEIGVNQCETRKFWGSSENMLQEAWHGWPCCPTRAVSGRALGAKFERKEKQWCNTGARVAQHGPCC